MRRRRGFTLVELMTVVTIMAVVAAVAIISLRANRSELNADAWANVIRNVAIQARRRAVATGYPYMIEISGAAGALRDRVQWCQVDNANSNNRCASQAVSCASPCGGSSNGPCEAGQLVFGGNDAMTDSWAAAADVLTATNTYTSPTKTTLGSATKQVFFGPRGTVDVVCANVLSSTVTPSGFTAYVRASNAVATANSATQKRRRVVLLGVTGRPRIIDNW